MTEKMNFLFILQMHLDLHLPKQDLQADPQAGLWDNG